MTGTAGRPAREEAPGAGTYRHEFTVPAEALDGNGHVNNVVYVQWMQDGATRHAEASGGTALAAADGGTWVVRSHRVEYLRSALAGDAVALVTWVSDFRKVRSLRRYRFLRIADGAVLAEGETDWVYLDAATGRPRTIPADLQRALQADRPPPEKPARVERLR